MIAGALDLRAALDAWIAGQRWRQAAAAAAVRWTAPQPAVTTVTRHQTAADVPALFDAPPTEARKPRRRRGLHAPKPAPEPVQRSILLPIAGNQAKPAAAIVPPIGASIEQEIPREISRRIRAA